MVSPLLCVTTIHDTGWRTEEGEHSDSDSDSEGSHCLRHRGFSRKPPNQAVRQGIFFNMLTANIISLSIC